MNDFLVRYLTAPFLLLKNQLSMCEAALWLNILYIVVVSLLVCNSRPLINAFLLDLRAEGNETLPGSLTESTTTCLQQLLPLVCAGIWDREQAAGLAVRHSLLVSARMLWECRWRKAGFN